MVRRMDLELEDLTFNSGSANQLNDLSHVT